jgi:hypothetical protein
MARRLIPERNILAGRWSLPVDKGGLMGGPLGGSLGGPLNSLSAVNGNPVNPPLKFLVFVLLVMLMFRVIRKY